MTRQTPTSKIQDGRAAEPASLAGEEQRALLLAARMLSAGPSAPAGGQLAALGRIRAAAGQFMQVPSSFSQSPQSFSRPLAPTSAYQTMPADLSRPAASSSTPGRAEPGPSDAIGGLMASALAQHHRQQQSLFSQFSSLHSLSAVATAMHHHQHLQNHHNQNHSTHNTLAPAQASLQRGPFEGPLNAGPPFSQFAAQPPSQPQAAPASWRPAGARRKRRGARKCRKVYGMAQRDVWCTQCKWKKACSRFAANQLVALEGAGGALAHKSPRLQAGAGATQAGPAQANGAEQLMSSLLDMSASFRRLQEAAQPPPSFTASHQRRPQ